jgi:hypothetical protein
MALLEHRTQLQQQVCELRMHNNSAACVQMFNPQSNAQRQQHLLLGMQTLNSICAGSRL